MYLRAQLRRHQLHRPERRESGNRGLHAVHLRSGHLLFGATADRVGIGVLHEFFTDLSFGQHCAQLDGYRDSRAECGLGEPAVHFPLPFPPSASLVWCPPSSLEHAGREVLKIASPLVGITESGAALFPNFGGVRCWTAGWLRFRRGRQSGPVLRWHTRRVHEGIWMEERVP